MREIEFDCKICQKKHSADLVSGGVVSAARSDKVESGNNIENSYSYKCPCKDVSGHVTVKIVKKEIDAFLKNVISLEKCE